MFINHNHKAIPVGDWVEMGEDSTGLYAVGKIDMNHADGPSLYSAMKRGAMTGLSIGFTMSADDFTRKEDGGRVIKNVNLRETSVVTFPCEDSARISSIKSELEHIESLKDCESYLRESGGMSKAMATAFIGHIRELLRSESADDLQGEIAGLKRQLLAVSAQLNTAKLITHIANL